MFITNSFDIVKFLKDQYNDYERDLIDIIDLSNNGVYLISEDQMYFSEEAKKILNSEDHMLVDEFIKHIHVNERQDYEDVTHQSSYEVTYRYNINKEKIVWIKEHGIYNYKNKKQRLAIITNYTSQVEQEKNLHRLAFYDTVTHLKNRNSFIQDANYLIQYQVPFALFLLDLNSFKLINDNFGHSQGDSVLKMFAEKLTSCIVYEHDFDIYRLSGDEFFIIFPYLNNKEGAEQIASLIAKTFNEPFNLNGFKLRVSPSIGISFFPNDSSELQTLIKFADISMYRAKNSSIQSYSFFDKDYYLSVLEEERIEEHIKYLIENQLIELFYQPIYDVHLNKIVGFEALFNTQSRFTPDKLFKTATKSHLVVLLDKYIIETVIKNISENKKHLPKDIRFTINVIPKTFEYVDVYEFIKNLLETYQVEGNYLGIEITEQYFVNDDKKVNELIIQLQSLGIKVYLDDFGMGYSSVRNLVYFSYDHIKLDRQMIASVFNNKKCELLIRNMIQFAKEINCDIIFEGIETLEQMNYVKAIGGKLIQGYYISKPIYINDAIKRLKL